MNPYVKTFLLRGLTFAGFGPIVLGIIYAIIQSTTATFMLNGYEVLAGIASTFLLAFVQAGATVFNQIEHWPLAKSLFFHFFTLYVAYSLCYVGNTWIPFEPKMLLLFTAIFFVGYFVVWSIVVLCVKASSRKLNRTLK